MCDLFIQDGMQSHPPIWLHPNKICSPPNFKWLIGFHSQQMLAQFVALQLHQMLVTYLFFQGPVFDGFIQPFFKRPDKGFFAAFLQNDLIDMKIKVLGFDFPFVQYPENGAIHQNGLEYLCQVQCQRVPSVSWFMQKADGRIELGMVNLIQAKCIAHHVAEGNQRVYLIHGGLLAPTFRGMVFQDQVKGPVIFLPNIALYPHQSRNIRSSIYKHTELGNFLQGVFQVFAPVLVVLQVFTDIKGSSLYKFFGDFQSTLQLGIVHGLLDLHFSGQQVFFWLKTARVMLVIIKKMHADARFSQKIIQGRIGVQAAKAIQVRDALHRDVLGCAFFSRIIDRSEFQCEILSTEPPWVEEVVGFFQFIG